MKRPHSIALSVLIAGALAGGLAAVPAGALAASGMSVIDAQYQQARQQARDDYTESLRYCHGDSIFAVRECRSMARADYQAELAAAREDYNAARQSLPLKTPDARFENARREAAAAYAQNKDACQQLGLSNRPQCMKEAAQRYKYEMLQARTELAGERLDRMADAQRGNPGVMRGSSDKAGQSSSSRYR